MNNRFELLKIFCVAAETLQFKEAANRLAVSPPVITKAMAELEDFLGEPLFVRNTRQIRLSAFGEEFLPQAQQLLESSEKLFIPSRLRAKEEMSGTVRITVHELPDQHSILRELLTALTPYPNIKLDWQKTPELVNSVENQIDIGIRIGLSIPDSNMIVKKLGFAQECIVAAPELLAKHGTPQDFDALQQMPLIGITDANTGRAWSWFINDEIQFSPRKTVFQTTDPYLSVTAAITGIGVTQAMDWACKPHIASGELVELFPEIEKVKWSVYLYRPQQIATPPRVRLVFELLEGIIGKRLVIT